MRSQFAHAYHTKEDLVAHGTPAPASVASTRTLSERGFTSFDLKIVAIACMTFDHAAFVFIDVFPFWVVCLMMAVGGATFPLMAFQLVEGYHHTSNLKRYCLRLGAFALVAQIPYGLFLSANLNILFTLLIGLVVLYLDDRVQNRAAALGCLAAGCLLSIFCDWAVIGVALIYMFKKFPEQGGAHRATACAACLFSGLCTALPAVGDMVAMATLTQLPFALFGIVGSFIAFEMIARYDGRRGRPLKYFFYVYYPGHIAVLGCLYLLLFGAMPPIS